MNYETTILFCLIGVFFMGIGIGYIISYHDKHRNEKEYQAWKNSTKKGVNHA